MRQGQFDDLRIGDKIRRRLYPNETLTVILNDAGSIVAVCGKKSFEATRLINHANWGFIDRPGSHLTDDEFYGLRTGDGVRYPYGNDRETFTVVLNDGDWIVAVKGAEKVDVMRIKNPGNIVSC